MSLPTGTVTFLFTDIEGSTHRWEAHREEMQAAVERHDEILRNVIETHKGYVFKTVGDAFCAAFGRVFDAVTATIDAQREFAKEDFSAIDGLRVRMGLHAGEASERNGDYFGPAVNRAARLMSIGHGGQVLLSAATRELVLSDLPASASLTDLGSHRLKDLTQAEQVWQLTVAGLPSAFPPLKSLDTLPNNLPIQPTSFRGREHDLEELKSLLGKHALLTLFGAGGVGKTRLALQAGADLLDHYPDGVWLADLAPITDPELVSSVVAKVLGMSQAEGRRVDESIPQWLKRKQLLLILDSCEHVVEAVATLADAILHTCSNVRVLATSRQALGIGGEEVLRCASLAVPAIKTGLTAAAAMEFGAVALFVDRATSVDKSFRLTDDTAPIVAEICRRLDGIPLAIELAAARVKVLSIPNLAQRLNERFKILTGGSRTALPRQKTLSALIDWSYDLLSLQEQTLLQRVGIFAGGFGLDAATAVCAGEGIDEVDVLDLLASLTDKSLVAAETAGEQERYRLLESTRAYALEKLAAQGKRQQLARRHAEYFRDVAQAADKAWSTTPTEAWLTHVEPELDNFRTALEWALGPGDDVVLGAATAGALQELWIEGGLAAEGHWWIAQVQSRLDDAGQPRVGARLWLARAALSAGKARYEASERALALFQSVDDGRGAAWALLWLANGLNQMGRLEEASEFNLRALAAMREYGDKRGVAVCVGGQAWYTWTRGDFGVARELYAQGIAGFRALEDDRATSFPLSNLGELEFAAGNVEQALRYASESLKASARAKNAVTLGTGHVNSAAYRIALDDLDGAFNSAREGLRWGREAQHEFIPAVGVQHLALIAALRGNAKTAARLTGFVDTAFRAVGYERQPTEKWSYEKLMASLHEQLSEAEIAKLATEGAACAEDQAVEEALKL